MSLDTLAWIIGLILAIPLWRFYHRIFIVFYRDVLWGILAEILTACVTGYFIAKFIIYILGGVASAIGTVVVFLLVFALAFATIYMWGMIIWMICHKINPYKKSVPELDAEIAQESYDGLSLYAWKTAQLLHKKNENWGAAGFTLLLLLLGTPCIYLVCIKIFGLE